MKNLIYQTYQEYLKAVKRGNELGGNYKIKTEAQWIQFEKNEIESQRASAHIGG